MAVGQKLCCLLAGTPVRLANGTTEPIEKLKLGDIVKSRDPATGRDADEPVLRLYSRPAAQIVDVLLTDGETLTCTPEHLFFVENEGLVEAGELLVGDQLIYDEA